MHTTTSSSRTPNVREAVKFDVIKFFPGKNKRVGKELEVLAVSPLGLWLGKWRGHLAVDPTHIPFDDLERMNAYVVLDL